MRRLGSFVLGCSILAAGGCGKSGAPAPAPPGDPDGGSSSPMSKGAVLSALGTCTLEVYRGFVPKAEQLAEATTQLAADGAPARWEAARAAWVEAMATWEEAEVFQYGPLAPRQTSPGAEDIRDNLYAWPFIAPCFVEQEIVSQRFREADFVTRSLVNVRGLGALEYLLFYGEPTNHCPPTATINSGGSWAALSADDLAGRKRAYAAVVAADVLRRARDLVDAWDPARRNFLGEVKSAGAGSKVFASTQQALNSMSHALFYLENPGKDVKLARPLGLRECAAPPCLDQLESRFAYRSKDHLARNLDGFEKLAFGCPAGGDLGFDDLLAAAGAGDLATRMRERMAPIRAALAAIPGADFKEALVSNRPAVQAVYDELRQLITMLKTEFVGILNLELPEGVQSDQD
jgi:uncharacterized protein